ncbi:MAG: ubiquinol-cytochrome C chaperone family protein [Acetobacteraceae bacterium]
MAGLIGFRGMRRAGRQARAAFALYGTAVSAARHPWFYQVLGVPDTLDGRFDLVALHAFLVIDRLQDAPPPGPDLAQAVFDAMFSDMDNNLRELGVSDLSVGKRMRAMWEAFHGRAQAYAAAIRAGDHAALEAALGRNVWRGDAPAGAAAEMARFVQAQAAHLAGQDLAALAGGTARFLPPPDVAPIPPVPPRSGP